MGVDIIKNRFRSLFKFLADRGHTEDELNTIIAAHRMIRNGPLTDAVSSSLSSVEAFALESVESFGSQRSFSDAEKIVSMARNITNPSSSERAGYSDADDECDSEYPFIDGRCNHPSGNGQPLQTYARLLPASYCDGYGSPRCSSDGQPLPNPREVSVYLRSKFDPADRPNKKTSHFLNVAGQFITHTVLKTPDRKSIATCGCEENKHCLNWSTENDAVFADTECNFITRSSVSLGNYDGNLVLEQVNQLTGTFQGKKILNKRKLEVYL